MTVQAEIMYNFSENIGMMGDWSLINPLPISDSGFIVSNPQPHHQLQQALQFHQSLGLSSVSNSTNSTCHSFPTTSFHDALSSQLESQRKEIDYVLQLQNEKLRFALQEQRKRQLTLLLRSFEFRTSSLIRQKEEHLTQARKRAIELQDCLRKAEMETLTWQRLAKANETMVMDLTNTLDKVKERTVIRSNDTSDAESCCDEKQLQEEVLLEKAAKLDCKSCNARRSCVLLLPCKHLCSCKVCEAVLDYCPVCKSSKEASMEVSLV